MYKRLFTPHEQQKAFSDESQYEDGGRFTDGIIREAVDLRNGDWLLGIENFFEDEKPNRENPSLEYYRLSEIRLMHYPEIENRLREAWLEDEGS